MKSKLYIIYVGLFYIIPLMLIIFRNDDFIEVFPYANLKNSITTLLFVSLLSAIILIYFKRNTTVRSKMINRVIFSVNPFRSKELILILSMFFLYLSFNYWKNYGIGFNHSGNSILEGGIFLLYFFSLKYFFSGYLFFQFYLHLKFYTRRTTYKKFLFVILTFSYYFSIGASLDFPLLLISLILLLQQYWPVFHSLFLLRLKPGTLLILFVTGILSISIGFINKYDLKNVDETFIQFAIIQVERRISNSALSLVNILNNYLADYFIQLESFKSAIGTFIYRISKIIGFESSKPELFSVMRLNYLLSYESTNLRAGASPGMFGSMLLLPFFPANIILMLIYIITVFQKIGEIFKQDKLNFIGYLLLIFFLIPLFSSPIDFLLILDTGVVYLFSFILSINMINNLKQ